MPEPYHHTATNTWPQGRSITDNLAPVLYRQTPAFIGIALAAFVLALECGRYLFSGAYFDHVEGNVLISGWQYLHGQSLYEMQDGAPRFATFYGPLADLLEVPALILLGATVTASKVTSMLALSATIIVISAHLARRSPANDASHSIFFLLAALLLFSPVSFWVRSDPFETLLVAVTIASSAGHRGPLWLGICLGLAINLKVHAFFYFLPLLVDLWWSRGWRAVLTASGIAAATVAVPFLSPRISIGNYVIGLAQQIGGRGQTLSQIWPISITLSLLLLPIAIPLAAQRQQQREKIYAAAVLATALLLLYPATAPGCGAYHFLPLVPVLADVRHRLRPEGMSAQLAPVAILVVASLSASQLLQEIGAERGSASVAAEALGLARESPIQPVQVGYGDNRHSYQLSQLSRTVLALNSYPTLIDAHVLMELREVGIDGSDRWIPYLSQCRIQRWLLPKGERPFAVVSYFYDKKLLFSNRFWHAFFEHYKLVASTRSFDLWDCTTDHQSSRAHKGLNITDNNNMDVRRVGEQQDP